MVGVIKRKLRRILTDVAGYGLLLLALLTGWLPGPGGIPLALAGLGLLSVHNAWARRIRNLLVMHGGNVIRRLFLDNPLLQALYDIVVSILIFTATVLALRHGDVWQVSLCIVIFCAAFVIGLINRKRYARLLASLNHKRK